MPCFFSYSFTLSGPNFANVPLANPLAANFAIAAAPSVPMILDLLLITFALMLLIAPFKLPSNAVWTLSAKPVLDANDKAVPASIADILKLLRALRLGAFRLATIGSHRASSIYASAHTLRKYLDVYALFLFVYNTSV
jgi:hypothetical protein